MKPGCLFKSLIFSTLFFAVLFYIILNRGNELFRPVQHKFAEMMSNEIKLHVLDVSTVKERDSLITFVQTYFDTTSSLTLNIDDKNRKALFDSLQVYTSDKKLTSSEVARFKQAFVHYIH